MWTLFYHLDIFGIVLTLSIIYLSVGDSFAYIMLNQIIISLSNNNPQKNKIEQTFSALPTPCIRHH